MASAIPTPVRRVVAREALRWLALLIGEAADKGAPKQLALWADQEWPTAEGLARVMVADRVIGMLRGVQKAVASGEIPAAWDRNDRMQELVTTGLRQYDPRIAFQATLRASYSAGRWDRGSDDDEMEYCLYRTMRDGRVRVSHEVLDGVYLPKSHKFWGDHFPPNGWRCRCKGIFMDLQGIERLKARGLKLQDTPPDEETVEYRDKVTGETTKLPASIEPGWNYNPGTDDGRARMRAQLERRFKMLEDPSLI